MNYPADELSVRMKCPSDELSGNQPNSISVRTTSKPWFTNQAKKLPGTEKMECFEYPKYQNFGYGNKARNFYEF